MSSTASLYTAVSGLDAQQQYLSVIANNLANINTVGFKASRVLFEDALSQTLQNPSLASVTSLGANTEQIGLGVSLAAITPQFTQGSLQSTGVSTDLAIQGQGFFVVENPNTGAHYYTRDGAFQMSTLDPADPNAATSIGVLTTATGQDVLGLATGGAALSPIYIPKVSLVTGSPTASFSIDSAGRVNVLYQDGTTSTIAQISMQNFSNPQALLNAGQNLYTATPASGIQFGAIGADTFQGSGTNGLGALTPGYLEQSNVDMGTEFSNMIVAQRGLEADAKTISADDEVLQDIINTKR